jgi:hypothetical protein
LRRRLAAASGRSRRQPSWERAVVALPDEELAGLARRIDGRAAHIDEAEWQPSYRPHGSRSTWLSAAIVAAAMAAVYGVSLYRTVLPRARTGVATLSLDPARSSN